jgi:hypothetical protein
MELAQYKQKLQHLTANKKGVGGVIYVLLGLMIMLLVAVIVVNALVNSQTPDTTWSAKANTTWAAIQTNIWIALGLVTVGLIVVGAMAILSYLNFGSNKGF